ncbi:hypothetical protein [Gulosibacter faecalis]|jgi:hypothetical protein|uniref:Cell division protein FtsL n=1 Tax=Gulosibacter faecalis TaxID=272240 RepID=A0ABW5V349_9MICO|nr:hypothetical protein [Gulosibacter faecalis]
MTSALPTRRQQPAPGTQPTTQSRPRLRAIPGLGGRPKFSGRMLVVALVALLIAFFVQLALSTVIIQDAYRADDLESQQLELEREHTAALEASDAAASPQHLAERATELGMVPSTGNSYLDLNTNSLVDAVEGSVVAGGGSAIDPSLVPNGVLDSKDDEAAEAEKDSEGGASSKEEAEPAVPSEFELSSPSTH